MLGAAAGSAATEPSVSGLWQKLDGETGKPVGWFLFVERNGLYEGVIANIAIAADGSGLHDMSKGPHSRAFADAVRFHQRLEMYEI